MVLPGVLLGFQIQCNSTYFVPKFLRKLVAYKSITKIFAREQAKNNLGSWNQGSQLIKLGQMRVMGHM